MIHYKRVESDDERKAILQLQRENLPSALSTEEKNDQGFVTVAHSEAQVKALNEIEPHIIAKEGDKVIAYLLVMTAESATEIPILQPMFELFGRVPFASKMVSDFRYVVVGQACVARPYRGKGILDACYRYYRGSLQNRYAFAITEIAATNLRSLRAHERIGFTPIYRYSAPDGVEWVIVVWDWNQTDRDGR